MIGDFTLKEAIELLKKREVAPYDLVSGYLDLIDKYNRRLNVYLTLNPEAIRQSKKISSTPNKSKPLLGVPIAIKDIFLTKGLRTTAASKLLDDFIPQYSATVVTRLVDAGAIILGKTNLDAWCHGSSTEASDYGPTRNPWDLNRVAGGSSGGSAAAVSANLAIASLGTETAGSIRGPAAWCGIVGLKPSYGRVSRYGVIAMGSSLDCPGPLTKTVEDAAILLEVLAGKDEYDATTSYKKVDNYSKALGQGVKGFKIGLAEDYLLPKMDKRVKELIKQAAKVFERLGAVVDSVKTLDPKYAIPDYTVIQRSEVSSNLSRYDGIRFGYGREYFGEEAKRRIMLGTFTLSAGYQDRYYKKAQRVRTLFIKDFERIFQKYDLIIGPTMPGPAPQLGITKGKAMFGEMADVLTEPTSLAGLPGISVPCGFVDGMPIGLDIIGPSFFESKILQAAYAYEQDTHWHKQRPGMFVKNGDVST